MKEYTLTCEYQAWNV